MRRFIFHALVLVVLGMSAALTTSAQCNPNVESPIKCGYYNAGYRHGQEDARANRGSDYRRYRNEYNRQYESAFRDGYQSGYSSSGTGISWWTSSQRSAYDSGYSIGQADRRQGGYGRTAEQRGYDSNIALYFQQGYNDGFNNIPRRYNFPIGDPRPEPPPWGGGNRNSAVWEGSVDDRANVVIRGSQIYTQNISGNGITTRRQNVFGSLPRRAVNVQVSKRNGRGDVRVIQQPNRGNNFSAVIQIYDSRGGRDDYGIEVTWTGGGGNVEEPYSTGSVQWRGRVDQTVDIIITGDFVDSRDVSGSGMIVTSSRLVGYLAQRPGRITATRRDGRGDVTVIQQPSRQNDYTAIVRISDTESGADNYSVDIRW